MDFSIGATISEAARLLRLAGISDPRREAGSLLEAVIDRDRTFVIGHAEQTITAEQLESFRKATVRRAKGEPLQYITGTQSFYGLEFEVTPDVLIPRPETELLVESALGLLEPALAPPIICDVGTGSGCITIAVLSERHDAEAIALDISPAALGVARRNVARHAVQERVTFFESDCFSALDKNEHQFDLIVSNPPYVTARALETLQTEVRDHEPRLALEAGPDGLLIIQKLLSEAAVFLKPRGHMLIEIGFDQAAAVTDLAAKTKWKLLDIKKDLQEIPRLVVLHKPAS